MTTDPSQPEIPPREELREYLLGLGRESPDEAQARFDALEEELFSASERSAALNQALIEEQDEIIDEFVCGSLSPIQMARFQQQIELSPSLAERVAEHRRLRQALLSRSTEELPSRASESKPRRWFGFRIGFPAMAGLAAAILLGVGHFRTVHHAPAPEVARATLPQAESPALSPTLTQTFFLDGAMTRSAVVTPVLRIRPGVTSLQFQLLVRDAPAGSGWRISLRDSHGEIWQDQAWTSVIAGVGSILSVSIPGVNVPDGPLRLMATPSAPSAAMRPRQYAFVIRR